MTLSPRAAVLGSRRPLAPIDWYEAAEHRRKIAEVANQAMQGKTNNTGSFTVAASVSTTTISDPRIGPDSVLTLMAKTANAAAEMDSLYFTSFTAGECVANHANNAQTDRVFKFVVVG